MSHHDAWNTEDELKYLRQIPLRVPPESRRAFLENYIEAARQRKRWAAIDKMTVMVAAHGHLYRSNAL